MYLTCLRCSASVYPWKQFTYKQTAYLHCYHSKYAIHSVIWIHLSRVFSCYKPFSAGKIVPNYFSDLALRNWYRCSTFFGPQKHENQTIALFILKTKTFTKVYTINLRSNNATPRTLTARPLYVKYRMKLANCLLHHKGNWCSWKLLNRVLRSKKYQIIAWLLYESLI